MNVGELKALIAAKKIPDEAEVIIVLPENIKPEVKEDYLRDVLKAENAPPCGLSGHTLNIYAGRFFAW